MTQANSKNISIVVFKSKKKTCNDNKVPFEPLPTSPLTYLMWSTPRVYFVYLTYSKVKLTEEFKKRAYASKKGRHKP